MILQDDISQSKPLLIKHYHLYTMKLLLSSILIRIRKTKQTTAFNLIGLSVSFAAFILLSVYIWNEFTFDHYNKNIEQVYILKLNNKKAGFRYWLPNPMADYFSENIPELSKLCSFAGASSIYSLDNNSRNSIKIPTIAVDSTFTQMFDLHMKYGGNECLSRTDGIIVSEETALKLFGDNNPVGKTIYANFKTPYVIEGVFYELPQNSSYYNNKAFCSFPTDSWVNKLSQYSFHHYFQLAKGIKVDEVVKKLNKLDEIDKWTENPSIKYTFDLIPLKDLHFNKSMGNGNLLFTQSLILVAFLLLFMGFVNYLNFAIAHAPKLKKAIHIRKILGESKHMQLLISALESVVIVSSSFIICIFLTELALYLWPDLLSYKIALTNYKWILTLSCLLFIVIGILISAFQSKLNIRISANQSLNQDISLKSRRNAMGKVLTVIQFGISIFLIIGVIAIQKQVNYFKNYDLGFSKHNIVTVNIPKPLQQHEEAFVGELTKNANIIDYTFSEFIPGEVSMGWGRTIGDQDVYFRCWPIDERYMNFMGFEVVDGRPFTKDLKADENNFIFNQTALKTFGWDKDYLGKEIPGFDFTGTLVGVVKDIKYASLREEVKPMAFWLTDTRHTQLSIKIAAMDVTQTIEYIQSTYEQFEKDYPIEYKFLDEQLDYQYRAEEKQAQLITIFCFISIIVSLIGLLGLISLLSEYRVKEIGIRKVNGATIFEILSMLNKGFAISVIIAFTIACPIAYYVMSKWLENFAYKTELSWWVFALAGVLALGIALITVSWQSWRAATRNPVEALRYE
jgi:putative ABC transport system permease protein